MVGPLTTGEQNWQQYSWQGCVKWLLVFRITSNNWSAIQYCDGLLNLLGEDNPAFGGCLET